MIPRDNTRTVPQRHSIGFAELLNLPTYLANHVASHTVVWLGAIVAFCCLMAFGTALARRPWADEGWFAGIAHGLLYKGVMGMTILDPHGFPFTPLVKDIDRYTY